MFLLSRDDVQNCAYQESLGVWFVSEKKDEKLKKINNKIVRNYILCAMLGGVVGGAVMQVPCVHDFFANGISNVYEFVKEKVK